MADLITCTGVPPAPAHNPRWRRCLKRGTDEVAASAAIQSRSISSKPFVVRRYTENAQILRSSRMSADHGSGVAGCPASCWVLRERDDAVDGAACLYSLPDVLSPLSVA